MSAASILCVEDEPSLRRDLVEELQDAGYVVYEAPDGRKALELLQTQQPDLVLCDVTMPDINGLELLKQLRASELPSAQVPFVFLTAHGQKSDLIQGREFGADDYLVKPVDFDLLLSLLRSRLQSVARARSRVQTELAAAQQQIEKLLSQSLMSSLSGRPALLKTLQEASEPVDLLLLRPSELQYLDVARSAEHQQRSLHSFLASLRQIDPALDTRVFDLSPHLYALVIPRCPNREQLVRGLDALRDQQTQIDGSPVRLRTTILLAPYEPVPEVSVGAFLDETLVALHLARREGADEVVVLTPKAAERTRLLRHVEETLPQAIAQGELFLQYEPKLQLHDRRIIGAEALVRWHSPTLGVISPGLFIPVIERLGLIGTLTAWVLDQALTGLRTLRDRGHHEIVVAVNVSGADLQNGLVDAVTTALERHGIPPQALEIEITETAIIQDLSGAAQVMRSLRDLGVHVAIDDFGTGHASLTYLRTFPVDSIKIDRLFVQSVDVSPVDQAIVGSVIALGSALGLMVVAEGVETESQRDKLSRLGCVHGQGYLFTRSLSLDQFEEMLRGRETGNGRRET